MLFLQSIRRLLECDAGSLPIRFGLTVAGLRSLQRLRRLPDLPLGIVHCLTRPAGRRAT